MAMMLILIVKGRKLGNSSGFTTLSVSTPPAAVIQISGDVAHPGIFEICDNKMTIGVIKMSMPFCDGLPVAYDTMLTTGLHAGDAVYLECKGPEIRTFISVTSMKSSQCLTLGIPLDLNQMSEADLTLLPGIGPVLAHRIVDFRQKNGDFDALEQLLQVKGIGEKKFNQLSHFFKIAIKQNK